jgi:hypothetical protein
LDTRGLRELLGRVFLSSPPHAPPLSLSCGPEGLRRSEGDSIAARRSPAGIPNQIQTNVLPQSWLDLRSGSTRRSPYVYDYYEVLHVRH